MNTKRGIRDIIVVDECATTSFIGHTRFATSSVNVDSELHPHEWVKFHDEMVWNFCKKDRRFKKVTAHVGIHITHNGDFDCLAGYDLKLTNEDIGLWLERVHHVKNDLLGDSLIVQKLQVLWICFACKADGLPLLGSRTFAQFLSQ